MSKNDLRAIITVLVVISIIVVIVIVLSNIFKKEKVDSEYEKIQLLDNVNYFFSIESYLNEIPEYVMNNNYYSLYGILNDEYISNNDITINNVLNKFNSYSYTSFDIVDVYVISSGNLYKFFIKSHIRNNKFEGNTNIVDTKYIILNYNKKDMIYNLEFISIDKYEDFINNKLEIYFDEVKSNDYNKFEYTILSESSLATYYLNKFIDLLYEDTKLAYESISASTKEDYFINYDSFILFINNHNDMFNNISISSYDFSNNNCYCVDNYGNEYKFSIIGVNNYNVTIYFKNV